MSRPDESDQLRVFDPFILAISFTECPPEVLRKPKNLPELDLDVIEILNLNPLQRQGRIALSRPASLVKTRKGSAPTAGSIR